MNTHTNEPQITQCPHCGVIKTTVLADPRYPLGAIYKDENGIERFNIGWSELSYPAAPTKNILTNESQTP